MLERPNPDAQLKTYTSTYALSDLAFLCRCFFVQSFSTHTDNPFCFKPDTVFSEDFSLLLIFDGLGMLYFNPYQRCRSRFARH